MSNFKRFNRHEVFNSDDRSLVLDIIKVMPTEDYDTVNHLFGLFDGYLYDGLMSDVACEETVTPNMVGDLSVLLYKTTQSILESK
tara:strand:+ start:106 stop:360 length:255 start_codon:yes stop_codon:yes gene_type:complete